MKNLSWQFCIVLIEMLRNHSNVFNGAFGIVASYTLKLHLISNFVETIKPHALNGIVGERETEINILRFGSMSLLVIWDSVRLLRIDFPSIVWHSLLFNVVLLFSLSILSFLPMPSGIEVHRFFAVF